MTTLDSFRLALRQRDHALWRIDALERQLADAKAQEKRTSNLLDNAIERISDLKTNLQITQDLNTWCEFALQRYKDRLLSHEP